MRRIALLLALVVVGCSSTPDYLGQLESVFIEITDAMHIVAEAETVPGSIERCTSGRAELHNIKTKLVSMELPERYDEVKTTMLLLVDDLLLSFYYCELYDWDNTRLIMLSVNTTRSELEDYFEEAETQ
jgi:hypothetical protein